MEELLHLPPVLFLTVTLAPLLAVRAALGEEVHAEGVGFSLHAGDFVGDLRQVGGGDEHVAVLLDEVQRVAVLDGSHPGDLGDPRNSLFHGLVKPEWVVALQKDGEVPSVANHLFQFSRPLRRRTVLGKKPRQVGVDREVLNLKKRRHS